MSTSSAHMLASDAATVPMRWQRPALMPGFGCEADRRTAETRDSVDAAHRLTPAERLEAAGAEAYARGVTDGQLQGEDAASARTEAIVRRLVETIDGVARLRADMVRNTERDLVRLAITMAERIVRRQIETDPDTLLDMARQAIERLGDDVEATVHLNPADHDAATEHGRRQLEATHVQVLADPQVLRGGCLVRSAFGSIDTGVDAQIEELSRGVLGEAPSPDTSDDGDNAAR